MAAVYARKRGRGGRETVRLARVNSANPPGRWSEDDKDYYEGRMLALLGQGMSDYEVAKRLDICDATVRRYRHRLKIPNIHGNVYGRSAA